MTSSERHYLAQLLKYSKKYEINMQLWPTQCSIFIYKDGIELYDTGGYEREEVLKEAVGYLRRINKEGE